MKTAVLFKAYMWNDTIGRLFELCKAQCPQSDLFIIYDNSRGTVDIPPEILTRETVLYMPFEAAERIGMIWGPDDSIYGGHWYNGDYHQSLFILDHPDYDYICPVESDVAVLNDIDAIFADMSARGIDAVYRPVGTPNAEWPHTSACVGFYDAETPIHKGLICISFLSRRAAMKVAVRRIEMAAQKRSSGLRTWPIGEAAVAHEIVSAGLTIASITEYCDTVEWYDWAPAYLESELSAVTGRTFVHPVLPCGEKFVISNFVQTYNGLASPEMIERGVSLARARRINRFDIYARLLHVNHVWAYPHHRQAVMASARETLDPATMVIAAKDNLADTHMIARQLNIPLPNAERWVAALPCYDTAFALPFGKGRMLRLQIEEGTTTLRVAAHDFPGLTLDVQQKDGSWYEGFLRPELEQGGLTIFRADLPPAAMSITLGRPSHGTAVLHWLQIT